MSLRVLHVISGLDPRHGGPTAALAALLRAQRDVGINVTLVSTYCDWDKLDAAEQLRREGFTVDLIGPATRTLAWSRHIKPALRRLIPQCDVVHVHALWEEIQHRAARVARECRKPYLVTPHGMLDPWSLRQGGLKKKLYFRLRLRRDLNQASAIHFTDDEEQNLTAPLNLQPPGIVERLIVDLADFSPPPTEGAFRSKHPQLAERPIVLFMSRVHPKKGLDLLIPAFAQCGARDAMLVIAGPDRDNYTPQLQATIAQHGISDRVIFTGMLEGRQRAEAMADAELFVLPSYQENFGVVVIEALSAGVPVILSDKVNIHRQISDHHVGEVVPTQVAPLVDALKRWLGDEFLREAASQRARQFVHAHYDRETLARRWIDHYQRLSQSISS